MAVWFMERDLVPDLTYQKMKKESSLTFYWNVQKLDTEKQKGMFKPEKKKPDDFNLSNGWWTNFLKRNPQLRLRAGMNLRSTIFMDTQKQFITWMRQVCL